MKLNARVRWLRNATFRSCSASEDGFSKRLPNEVAKSFRRLAIS